MKVILEDREVQEIREKVQLIETVFDGATQSINPDKKRLSKALSPIRSIQSKFFPQLNYSLYYFRGGHGIGNQPLSRQNYRKWKKLKLIAMNSKITEWCHNPSLMETPK